MRKVRETFLLGKQRVRQEKEEPFIILTSTRSDKYDRYLADVFIPGKIFLREWAKGTAVIRESSDLLFLNNALLLNRHAVRFS